jgi:hypothetical protein
MIETTGRRTTMFFFSPPITMAKWKGERGGMMGSVRTLDRGVGIDKGLPKPTVPVLRGEAVLEGRVINIFNGGRRAPRC